MLIVIHTAYGGYRDRGMSNQIVAKLQLHHQEQILGIQNIFCLSCVEDGPRRPKNLRLAPEVELRGPSIVFAKHRVWAVLN